MIEKKLIKWFLLSWLVLTMIIYFSCSITPKEGQTQPLEQVSTNRCTSQRSGSTPACWNDQDWEAFCERVRCKPNPSDCWADFRQCELENQNK